jgi:hypothetical protein
MRRSRTQDERDATTVEMVYAVVTGALFAAAGFTATISPVLAGLAHGTAGEGWYTAAVVVAAGLFCGRVALTLRRFEWQNRLRGADMAPGGSTSGAGRSGRTRSERYGERRGGRRGGRYGERRGGPTTGSAGHDMTAGQPSQPGRTNPDS